MATLYDEPFWTPVGARPQLLVNQTVTVYEDEDGVQSASLLDLFTDETGATPSANPFTSDSAGNVRFWSDAAFAWVKVGNHAAIRVQVQVLGETAALEAHLTRTDNPHAVTKAQVGLANVDNTSDADKPVSTAQAAAVAAEQSAREAGDTANATAIADEATARGLADAALDARVDVTETHLTRTDNPHTTTKAQVGLANVDNTSDMDKPVSVFQQDALDLKADIGALELLEDSQTPKSLFDANSLLIADTDDTPIALTVAASRVLGRKATGGIVAMTTAELKELLGFQFGEIPGPESTWLYVCDPSQYVSVGTLNLANRAVFVKRVTPAVPISKVALMVGTQSGNIDVGAYAHDVASNGPGALLAATGSIACPAAGEAEVALGATVTPDWLALSVDNNTATFRLTTGAALVWSGGRGRLGFRNVFPLTDPAGSVTSIAGILPILVGKP